MAFTFSQKVGATLTHAVDVRGKLDPGDTVTGTPIVISSPSGLTIVSPQKNSAELEIKGKLVPIGKAISAIVSGGVVGESYTLSFEFDTTNGSHRFSGTITIIIEADPT